MSYNWLESLHRLNGRRSDMTLESMRTVAICAFGCKLSHVEARELERRLVARGLRVVPFCERASTYIVNTCTVTAHADRSCRQALRRARRQNPEARVVAFGCYAAAQPEELSKLREVDWVVGDFDADHLVSRLLEADQGLGPLSGSSPAGVGAGTRTRAFVKIQDGCDNDCSYCIVRVARGPSRSRSLTGIVEDVRGACLSGCREVVLTGINLGAWGKNSEPRGTLSELIDTLVGLPELERLRVSSIEPTDFEPSLLRSLAHPKVCDHWHIPIQSGSARVLRAMRRHYQPEHLRHLFSVLHDEFPDAALGTDVIVGFPGESARDFEQTRTLLEALPLAYLHVFPFSARPGTEAARLPDQVGAKEKRERAEILGHLARAQRHRFEAARVGRRYRALIQRGNPSRRERKTALTRNYLKILVDADPLMLSTLQDVDVTGWENGRLTGKLVDAQRASTKYSLDSSDRPSEVK